MPAVTAAPPVPPIAGHSVLVLLLQVGLLLLLAIALGRLCVRFKLPAVAGELTAGVILGPSLMSQVAPGLTGWLFPPTAEQFHLLDIVGQIGVLLLVGITGAHLDLSLVRKRSATVVRVSVFGLVIPLGLGVATGLMLPATMRGSVDQPVAYALFLGAAMAVSAIPVIAKILFDLNLVHRNIGQLTLASGMVDDCVGWFLLSLVSAIATDAADGSIAVHTALVFALLAAVALAGIPVVGAVFRLAARAADPAPTIAAFVVLVLLAAAGAQALSLEPVFGAFLCGILVKRYGKPDPARMAPLRTCVLGVFAPIYFASAGIRMDLTALRNPEVLGIGLAVLAIAVTTKFAGAYLGAFTSRMTRWEALALGAGMNTRGVVQVIFATVGLRLGILNTAMYTIIILVALATSLMAPPILRFAMARIEHTAEEHLRLQADSADAVPVAATSATTAHDDVRTDL